MTNGARGADLGVGRDGTKETLTLGSTKTLGDVIKSVAKLATNKGDWAGIDQYNCQDFVVAFMIETGLSNSQIFAYELKANCHKTLSANGHR
jgi:hypothetical protein